MEAARLKLERPINYTNEAKTVSRTSSEHEGATNNIAKREVRGVEKLSTKLSRRWLKQSLSENFEIGEKFRRDFKKVRADYEKWRLELWRNACEQYLFAHQKGKLPALLGKIRNAGIQTKQTSHPLIPILRWLGGMNHDRASRWAMGLRFAMLRGSGDGLDEVFSLLDAEGGIESCADKFREWQRKNVPSKEPAKSSDSDILHRARLLLKDEPAMARFPAPKDGPSTALAILRRTRKGRYRVKHILDDAGLISKALHLVVAKLGS